MNGQLSEHPLVELVAEISAKKLSGRLKLEFERFKIAVYFTDGKLVYAASNVRTLRLAEYLVKAGLLDSTEALQFVKTSDFELALKLVNERRVTQEQISAAQSKSVADVLRLCLMWIEGTWEFDGRSHLKENIQLQIDLGSLMLEATRRLPPTFVATRLKNPNEKFSLDKTPDENARLQPTEAFLITRVDVPTSLSDLITLSGMKEEAANVVVYTLTVAGIIKREYWNSAFRDVDKAKTEAPKVVQPEIVAPPPVQEDTIETFLGRITAADSHYEVLDVNSDANMAELKRAYYDIARKYHPDKYRSEGKELLLRVESAFARITQAYDTLRDPGQRATYDSKLDAQKRAARLAASAPKASQNIVPEKPSFKDGPAPAPFVSTAEQAEVQFKEGFAALGLGQRNVAIGLLGSAARSVPNEPRYRAYYGRVLAMHESTRRLAEVELIAAVKMEPKNSEYRLMLAELYRDLGFAVRAKTEAERAVAADQNNKRARDLLRSLG